MIEKLKAESYSLFPALVSFLVYLYTLSPSVDFIDSGELTAVSFTLGIAHPTGYPLFTFISRVFLLLPLPLRVISKANLFSALSSSLAIFFFAKFLISIADKKAKDTKLFASLASLALSFSLFFWEQALSFEVYSFQSFLISLVLYSLFKFRSTGDLRYFFFFSFLLGLSFTNHLTIIFLIPSVIYIFISEFRREINFKISLFSLVLFLIGLTPFVYLPIRAKTGSFLNWGDPSTLENFLNHITGKQYRVWAFSSFEVMMRQISYYVSTLPENFGYFAILFALIGLVKILKFDKKISRFTLIAFITCLLISSNYDIHDIDAYFLVSYFILAVWIFHGMTHLPSRIPKPFVVAFGVVCIISTIGFNFKKVNKSENFLPENYTLNILNNLKRNAIVISYQWDYFVSPALYFQLVEGIRKDVVVIDKELLRRSWYIKQLEKNYPWLIQKSSEEVNAFLVELYKFEHNLPYDPMVIEEKFIKMINSFIDKNIEERPVYVGIEIEPEIGKKYNRVPEGFMFVLYKDGDYKDYNFAGFEVKGRIYNKYFDNLLNLIVKMILNRGIYEFKHGKRDKAKFYFEEALRIKPESVEAKLWLERAVKGG
jgi:hypothetical protein